MGYMPLISVQNYSCITVLISSCSSCVSKVLFSQQSEREKDWNIKNGSLDRNKIYDVHMYGCSSGLKLTSICWCCKCAGLWHPPLTFSLPLIQQGKVAPGLWSHLGCVLGHFCQQHTFPSAHVECWWRILQSKNNVNLKEKIQFQLHWKLPIP